jgi:hypothetical protein
MELSQIWIYKITLEVSIIESESAEAIFKSNGFSFRDLKVLLARIFIFGGH